MGYKSMKEARQLFANVYAWGNITRVLSLGGPYFKQLRLTKPSFHSNEQTWYDDWHGFDFINRQVIVIERKQNRLSASYGLI